MKTSTVRPLVGEFAAIIGIDWADQKHDVFIIETETLARQHRVLSHTAETLHAWVAELRQRFGGRKVAVVLEQSKGPLIYALMSDEFLVLYPINPKCLADFRKTFATSRAKNDPTDAELLAELILKHAERFRAWQPEETQTRLLGSLTEGRRKTVNLRTRVANMLTSTLKSYFPQLLEWGGEEAYSVLTCDLVLKWPTLMVLQKTKPETLRKFYYAHNCRRGDRIEARLAAIAAATPLTRDEAVVGAASLMARTLATQLKSLTRAIDEYDRQIAKLFAAHADAPIFQSFPAAGEALAPRLLTAFGTDRQRYESALAIQPYSGIAPVTETSGASSWTHRRWACPKFIKQTFHEYAGVSIPHSLWAKAYYDQLIENGRSHHTALRSLAFKWMRIMFRCWKEGRPYDEVQYLKALQKRGSGLLKRIAQPTLQTA